MPSLPANFKRPGAVLAFGLALALGLTADLVTKYWAFAVLSDGIVETEEGYVFSRNRLTYAFIPGLLDFTTTINQGAVFGIGQGQRTLFLLVSFGAIGVIGYLFAKSGPGRLYQVLLGMLLAGVLGNMYDRLVYHGVRDMIHLFPDRQWSEIHGSLPQVDVFPYIFNVADSLLCVGVFCMILYTLFTPDPAAAQDEKPGTEAA
ncbi:MAG: signal peptidase II [Phycisphaerae bacterium]